MVYAVAFRFFRNAADAEDITQEVFIRLWRGLSSYQPERSKLSTWLYRITTNCCLDMQRKQAGRVKVSHALPEAAAVFHETVYDELEKREVTDIVLRLANSLPPKQRMVFILRDLEGLSPEEVAQVLEMSVGSVKSNLCHARRKIAGSLGSLWERN